MLRLALLLVAAISAAWVSVCPVRGCLPRRRLAETLPLLRLLLLLLLLLLLHLVLLELLGRGGLQDAARTRRRLPGLRFVVLLLLPHHHLELRLLLLVAELVV